MIFSNIFLPILHNIGLYIYTIKYKSGIKIPGFFRNISKKIKTFSKKISKTFKSISLFKNKKKIFCFHAYSQILKIFQAYFHKKNCIFSMVFLKNPKMDIITSL